MMDSAEVLVDEEKNRFFTIYLSALAMAGIALIVCSALFEWGFYGYFGGGFLLVAGAGGLASKKVTGGAGLAKCPKCGTLNKIFHITQHRYLKCGGCGAWLEGAETMSVVPPDRI